MKNILIMNYFNTIKIMFMRSVNGMGKFLYYF